MKQIVFGPIAGAVGGLCMGIAIGSWAAHVIQGWVYGDPLQANLPAGLAGLFGGLLASGGFKLGRWLSSIRHLQLSMRTVSLEFLLATVRVATAAMGLFIGACAGLWTAGLALYLYEPYAKGLDDKDWFAGNTIIGSSFLWGGLLALLGYRLGRSLPAAASWTGLFLGLLAGIYAAPFVASLHRGPIPSDDALGEIEITALLVSTCLSGLVLAIAGHRLGLWFKRRLDTRRQSVRS